MSAVEAIERRRVPRRRILKSGRILLNKLSVISCTVRNLGEFGARLEIPSVQGVPDEFFLEISGEQRFNCHVIWRRAREMGVVFL